MSAVRAANNQTPDPVKVKVCPGHTRPVCHINYSNIVDGSYWFVTSCHDMKPMLRNGETGDWVGTFEGHRGAIFCSAFNAGATHLVTGSGDYNAFLWDALTGELKHKWEHPQYIKSCDWVGDQLVTGCYDGRIRLFDVSGSSEASSPVAAREPKLTIQAPHRTVKAVYFPGESEPDAVIAAAEHEVMKFDLRSGRREPVIKRELPGLNVLEYTHKNYVVASHGKSVALLDPASLLEKEHIVTNEDIECASLSPEGSRLAVGSKIKAKEFLVEGGAELENHRGHHGPIFHVRWSPDGNTFTTGAEDGMVRIWPSHELIQIYENNNGGSGGGAAAGAPGSPVASGPTG